MQGPLGLCARQDRVLDHWGEECELQRNTKTAFGDPRRAGEASDIAPVTKVPQPATDAAQCGDKLSIWLALAFADNEPRLHAAAPEVRAKRGWTIAGEDVVQTLEQVCGRIVYPKTIRVDNCSEFISRDLDLVGPRK